MTRILVDYENIPKHWEDLIQFIEDSFVFYLITPKDAEPTLKVTNLLKLGDNQIKIVNGLVGAKNALDIQLASILGSIISLYPNDKFYIVSDDKIFRLLSDFWQDFNDTDVRLVTSNILSSLCKSSLPSKEL